MTKETTVKWQPIKEWTPNIDHTGAILKGRYPGHSGWTDLVFSWRAPDGSYPRWKHPFPPTFFLVLPDLIEPTVPESVIPNPLQAVFDRITEEFKIATEVKSVVRNEAKAAGQITLGEFIKALSALPPDAPICYRGAFDAPCSPHSYRGYYDQLAFEGGQTQRTVADVLADAEGAVGNMYEGYKGGEFWMTEDTMIWKASWGSCGDRITGVEQSNGVVYVISAPYEN